MSAKKKKPPLPVRKIRDKLGLTQDQFADKLGVSSITVSRWERDNNRPLPIFEKQIEKLMEVFPGEKNG